MNLQKRATIDKATKLYESYIENIEAAVGTLLHGVAWAAKDCLDVNSPNYVDERSEADSEVAKTLFGEALKQVTDAAVMLRYISCKERSVFFKGCINAAIQLQQYCLASNMALVASEKPRDKSFFLDLYNKYKGMKDVDLKGRGVVDLAKFEAVYV